MDDFWMRKKVEGMVVARIVKAKERIASLEKDIAELESDLEYGRASLEDWKDEVASHEAWLTKYGAGPNMEEE